MLPLLLAAFHLKTCQQHLSTCKSCIRRYPRPPRIFGHSTSGLFRTARVPTAKLSTTFTEPRCQCVDASYEAK